MGKKEKTPEEIALKVVGKKWKNTGLTVVKCELWLSKQQKEITDNLPSIVVTKENIVLTEETLAEARKSVNAMKEGRSALTRAMDDVKRDLMQPEKDCALIIDELSSKLLTVKKAVKKENDALALKVEQKTALKLAIKTTYDKLNSERQRIIDDELTNTYAVMLEARTPLENYDSIAKSSVDSLEFPSLKDFFLKERTDISALSEEEKKAVQVENIQEIPNYSEKLAQKFIDKKVTYQAELNNVEEALKQNQLAAKEAQKKREHDATGKELSNKIEAVAANQTESVPAVATGKKLKVTYEIDMEENVETCLLLWACFSANLEECLKHLKVSKWFSLTPKQLGTVLGKLKSSDNEFGFTGIVFKAVEKL
tara:strand:- start:2811 stop:3914 length:1104 start_codon:yes stop_codon:yes gene_type:complete